MSDESHKKSDRGTASDSESTQVIPRIDKNTVSVREAGEPTPTSRSLTAGEYAKSNQGARPTTTAPHSDRNRPSAQAPRAAASGTKRKAHLRVASVSPWSVTKVSFALSVALAVVAFVAVSILWVVLGMFGVWDAINSSVGMLSDQEGAFDITDYVGYGRVIGLTLVISAINVILMTAIATIGAYLYNLAAQLLGGVDLTLTDEA